ncbi:MAG: tetraacyldisaccharide 4'-kinase [Alphaproteobacteria bacterium]|nr:tetraacyldisaccharide 4'-kinase [Alphaproteobacteria bacterium]
MKKIFAPFGWLYFLGTKVRWILTRSQSVSVPVICVGNITVGGTGKTPLVLALAAFFKKEGKTPHVLSRGYGGNLTNKRVDIKKHTAKEVGDEPRMLAEYLPVWIGKNRKKTAEMAIKAGADILIMDDGFQNNTLKKDFSIVVFDGKKGIGNGLGLPGGVLREPLRSGLKRADAIVIVGKDKTRLKKKIAQYTKVTPIFFADFEPLKLPDLRKKYLAFAGIGRPQKFFDTLKTLSVHVIETFSFPDHYVYRETDIKRLLKEAEAQNATLITTEKDETKVPELYRKKITTLKIKMVFQEKKIFELIRKFIF